MPPVKAAKTLKQDTSAKTVAPLSLASDTTGPLSPSPPEPTSKTPAKILLSYNELTSPMTQSKANSQTETPKASSSSTMFDTSLSTQPTSLAPLSSLGDNEFKDKGKKRKETAAKTETDTRPLKAKATSNGDTLSVTADDLIDVLISPATSNAPAICTENFADFYEQRIPTAVDSAPLHTPMKAKEKAMLAKFITPTPPGGFPEVFGSNPFWHFAFWASESVKEAMAESSMTLIHPWGVTITHDDAPDVRKKILDSMAVLLPQNEDPHVFIPRINENNATNPKGCSPQAFGIYNISEASRDFLTTQQVFSLYHPPITFFAYRPGWEIPKLITTLAGYTTAELSALPAIRKAIIAKLRTNNDIVACITEMTLTHANYGQLDHAGAIEKILNTVRLGILEMKLAPNVPGNKVCVYLDTPTANPVAWLQLQRIVSSLSYAVHLNGTGESWELDIACTGCGGMDHWRGLCPFKKVPQWNGALTKSESASAAAQYDNSWTAAPTHNDTAPYPVQRGRRGSNNNPRGRGGPRGRGRGKDSRARGGRGGQSSQHDTYSY
ncbi:hypothetical protein BC835DRAFT_1423362 [Cytidiella melzeri]|nr:hypothetical protein BC835DRAFT_1423362 [Cytidiella melzeri]